MSTFEFLILILSFLTLVVSIAAVYVSMRIAIAKIEIKIKNLERDFDRKEIAFSLMEKNNREDHIMIMKKLDDVIEKINK